MGLREQMEREEDALLAALHRGDISQEEYNCEVRELRRDYAEMAHEAADFAWQNEYEQW